MTDTRLRGSEFSGRGLLWMHVGTLLGVSKDREGVNLDAGIGCTSWARLAQKTGRARLRTDMVVIHSDNALDKGICLVVVPLNDRSRRLQLRPHAG